MKFAYLKDPLFLLCFFTYWAHRVLASVGMSTALLQAYLNDLVCAPFWAPPMVWTLRRIGLRGHDLPPQAHEIIIPLLMWSAVFEVALPAHPRWAGLAVADPNDVLCYVAGGLVAFQFWTWRYSIRDEMTASATFRQDDWPL